MDAETMIERLTRAQSYITTKPTIADAAMLHIAEVIAALRAQAKAEPVAWYVRHESGRCDLRMTPPASAIEGATITPLYLAPPPDHAEALAEALGKVRAQFDCILRLTDDTEAAELADDGISAIDAALTRYKESRNG
jgi:hypothetical protein